MLELPPIPDDDLTPIQLATVIPPRYEVPFKLTESMLCYNCSEDINGRRDLVGWLDVTEDHYRTCHNRGLPSEAYGRLHAGLKRAFPRLDFDCVSLYCDFEDLCPRETLIGAWRAFLVEMSWGEKYEQKSKRSRRQ